MYNLHISLTKVQFILRIERENKKKYATVQKLSYKFCVILKKCSNFAVINKSRQ